MSHIVHLCIKGEREQESPNPSVIHMNDVTRVSCHTRECVKSYTYTSRVGECNRAQTPQLHTWMRHWMRHTTLMNEACCISMHQGWMSAKEHKHLSHTYQRRDTLTWASFHSRPCEYHTPIHQEWESARGRDHHSYTRERDKWHSCISHIVYLCIEGTRVQESTNTIVIHTHNVTHRHKCRFTTANA